MTERPCGGVQLGAVGVRLCHDGGGGHCRQRAVEDRLLRRNAEDHGHQRARAQRCTHLQAAADKHRPRPMPDVRERKLEADREQQQCDPQLREQADLVGSVYQADAVRADNYPGGEEADQRRNSQPVRQRDDRNRETDENQQQLEKLPDVRHVSI